MARGENVYQPDDQGFTRLATGPEMAAHMQVIGDHWAEVLRGFAPRDPPEEEYVNSIDVRVEEIRYAHKRRAAVTITADVPYAVFLEIGTERIQEPPRPLNHLLDLIDVADPGVP